MKLVKYQEGHEISKEITPRGRSRNVIAQLLGLDPLSTVPELPERPAKVTATEVSVLRSQTDGQFMQVESSIWHSVAQQKSVPRIYWQHEAESFDHVVGVDSVYDDSEKRQLNVLQGKMELQSLKSWSTSRSAVLEPERLATAEDVRTLKRMKMKKLISPNDVCVSSNLGVSFAGYDDSEEIEEAIDILQSNKDLFSKFLEQPDSLFVRHLQKGKLNTVLHSQLNGSSNQMLTYNVEDSSGSREGVGRPHLIKHRKSLSTEEQTQHMPHAALPSLRQKSRGKVNGDDEYPIIHENEVRNGGFQSPTKIVLLKPSSEKIKDQKPNKLSRSSYQTVPSTAAKELKEDNSQDVLELLTDKLRKVQGSAKREERLGRQRNGHCYGNDCRETRENAREIARQVRETITGEIMQGHATRRKSTSSFAINHVDIVTRGLPTEDELQYSDHYKASSAVSSTTIKQTSCFEPQRNNGQHFTLPVDYAYPGDHIHSKQRIRQLMIGQNKGSSNGGSQIHRQNGLTVNAKNSPREKNIRLADKDAENCNTCSTGSADKTCTDIQLKRGEARPKQARYAERLGKILLETNKTKVDVAVQSLLSRDRRLSSNCKTVAKKHLFNQNSLSLQPCNSNLRQDVPAPVPGEMRNTEASIKPALTESNTLFEEPHDFTSSFASCSETDLARFESAFPNYNGMTGRDNQQELSHQTTQACAVIEENCEHQTLPESPRNSTTLSTAETVNDKCEMLSALSKNSSTMGKYTTSVDFKEATSKLQELRLRLQLLKKEEQDTPPMDMNSSHNVTTEEADLINNHQSDRAAACNSLPQSALEHFEDGSIHMADRFSLDLNTLEHLGGNNPPKVPNLLYPIEADSTWNSVQRSNNEYFDTAQVACSSVEVMEMQYMNNILAASRLSCSSTYTIISKWHSPTQPLDPQIFSTLENSYKDTGVMVNGKCSFDTSCRRLLFDFVNEVLVKILAGHLDRCTWPRTLKATLRKELWHLVWKDLCKLYCGGAYTIEHLVAKDIAQLGMDLVQHIEKVGIELEAAILNDLIEEVLLDT